MRLGSRSRYPLHFLLGSLLLLACGADGEASFEKTSPESAGFSSERLEAVQEYLEQSGSAAFLALHDGKEFFSWGRVHKKYPVHSIRKALLNSLYGIFVHRGVIDTAKTLADLGIDDVPPRLTEREKQARVADLLRSRSGVYHPAAAEAVTMIEERPLRGSHEPDAHFYYNNWDFNALGTIFEQETGLDIFEAFETEIARPLGMKDFQAEDGMKWHDAEVSKHPAYHFWMTAHDLALFGLLYERDGICNGRRILHEEWIRMSTRAYSEVYPDLGVGYGMLWYASEEEGPERFFFHTGAGVHVVAIVPSIDLVFVHRVDTEAGDYDFRLENLVVLWDLFLSARTSDSPGDGTEQSQN